MRIKFVGARLHQKYLSTQRARTVIPLLENSLTRDGRQRTKSRPLLSTCVKNTVEACWSNNHRNHLDHNASNLRNNEKETSAPEQWNSMEISYSNSICWIVFPNTRRAYTFGPTCGSCTTCTIILIANNFPYMKRFLKVRTKTAGMCKIVEAWTLPRYNWDLL